MRFLQVTPTYSGRALRRPDPLDLRALPWPRRLRSRPLDGRDGFVFCLMCALYQARVAVKKYDARRRAGASLPGNVGSGRG